MVSLNAIFLFYYRACKSCEINQVIKQANTHNMANAIKTIHG